MSKDVHARDRKRAGPAGFRLFRMDGKVPRAHHPHAGNDHRHPGATARAAGNPAMLERTGLHEVRTTHGVGTC